MPEYKFSYRVSGIVLSEAQRTRISEEISLAVTRSLLGESPAALGLTYEGKHPICGGAHRRDERAPEESTDEGPGKPATPVSEDPSP